MQPISLYDEIILEIEDGMGIFIECDNKSVPSDKTNLAYRAAEIFFKTTGITKKLFIKINKNIPVAGGLGGGSSNAAIILKALNDSISANLSQEDLKKMGGTIGSDVPFFISGKSSIAKGRGEILEQVELHNFWYILINPRFYVSTQWVYQNLNLTKRADEFNIIFLKKLQNNPLGLQELLINDLEVVTIKKHPIIKEIKDALISLGAVSALMSGSGPTVFGIFMDEGSAKETFEQIKKAKLFQNMALFMAQGL